MGEGEEWVVCERYIGASQDERLFSTWREGDVGSVSLIVTQGFEERSVGFIESCAATNMRASSVVVASHSQNKVANCKYQDRFEAAGALVSQTPLVRTSLDADGDWVADAIKISNSSKIVLDITGIGTRGLFGALDAAIRFDKEICLAYTEAAQYWPKQDDWLMLKNGLGASASLPDLVNDKPWLFSHEHKVGLIPKHEGYDSAGAERGLVGFLPFKYARLAAVLSAEEYSNFLFVAGRPRLAINNWRYDALLEINRGITKNWPITEMSTFGYRSALRQLTELLLGDEALLAKCDIHLALMGSKLQDVACWILSCLIPSITIITAVPAHYYYEAFSEGIGERWVFPLLSPRTRVSNTGPT